MTAIFSPLTRSCDLADHSRPAAIAPAKRRAPGGDTMPGSLDRFATSVAAQPMQAAGTADKLSDQVLALARFAEQCGADVAKVTTLLPTMAHTPHKTGSAWTEFSADMLGSVETVHTAAIEAPCDAA